MSGITLKIDGKQVESAADMTILEAARQAGIAIPTLCHHEQLEPFGGCRLCIVEAMQGGRSQLVASCVHHVSQDLIVRTRSDKIDRIRKTLLELVLAHAPTSPQLLELAEEYSADIDRFDHDSSFCIHCGLCVRHCSEIAQKYALGFIDRGPNKEISFVPEIARKECDDCKGCFPLCPTSYLQAAYVLSGALARP